MYYPTTNKLREVVPVTKDKVYSSGPVRTDNIVYRNVTINGSAYVPQGSSVEVKALENIRMDPAFESPDGTDFWAHILADEGTYQYDAIGNLILDQDEGVQISWTPYGKVREVHTKGDSIVVYFRYDGSGNRVGKKVVRRDTVSNICVTRYVRDARGNVMAIYKDTVMTEQPIYGSSRIGQFTGTREDGSRTLGKRKLELSNHLGNVLVVVADHAGMERDSVWAVVMNTNDYYPFGLEMQGRLYVDTTASYRYGFNGKEKDQNGEFGNTHYDYGFRIYNPRIGRFLSVDPLTNEYPWNSTYAFAENDVIRSVDLEGAERFDKTYSYTVSNGRTVQTVTNDVWVQKTDISINLIGEPPTYKQAAASNAITYQRNPKPGNGSFAYFEFAPELGKSNYAKYSYTDANGEQQVQYFSQADMQFRFDEIMAAKRKLDVTFNVAAAAANLIAAGWLLKAELKGLAGELKTTEVKIIKSHLEQFGVRAENTIMLERMQKIAKGEMIATEIDINFARHELREAELMKSGMSYEKAHESVLKEQSMYHKEYGKKLYTEEALKAGNAQMEKEVIK